MRDRVELENNLNKEGYKIPRESIANDTDRKLNQDNKKSEPSFWKEIAYESTKQKSKNIIRIFNAITEISKGMREALDELTADEREIVEKYYNHLKKEKSDA